MGGGGNLWLLLEEHNPMIHLQLSGKFCSPRLCRTQNCRERGQDKDAISHKARANRLPLLVCPLKPFQSPAPPTQSRSKASSSQFSGPDHSPTCPTQAPVLFSLLLSPSSSN